MDKGLIVHTLIYNKAGEILIIKRSKNEEVLPNYWDLPGGTLEDGESPKEGALREIKEEIKLTLKKPELFYFHSNVDKKKNKQFITLLFIARYNKGTIKLNLNDHSEFKWINPKETMKTFKLVPYLENCLKFLNKETCLENFKKIKN